jgi:hypothetical protein
VVEVAVVEASLQMLGWCQQPGSFYRGLIPYVSIGLEILFLLFGPLVC